MIYNDMSFTYKQLYELNISISYNNIITYIQNDYLKSIEKFIERKCNTIIDEDDETSTLSFSSIYHYDSQVYIQYNKISSNECSVVKMLKLNCLGNFVL